MKASEIMAFAGLVVILACCTGSKDTVTIERKKGEIGLPITLQTPIPRSEEDSETKSKEITIKENVFDMPERYPVADSSIANVEKQESLFYVVYKDTFYESHVEGNPVSLQQGYNTEVIRFPIPPAEGESISQSAWISQLHEDGEKQAFRYLMQRATDFLRVTALVREREPEEFRIYRISDGVRIETKEYTEQIAFTPDGDLTDSILKSGALEIIFIWSAKFGGVFATADTLGEPSDGRFEGGIEKPTRYVERPRSEPGGGADTEIDFAYPPEGIWIRADGVEPINECLFVGLHEWLRGGDLLERYAIARTVLRYHQGIDPVLAAAVLAIHGGR